MREMNLLSEFRINTLAQFTDGRNHHGSGVPAFSCVHPIQNVQSDFNTISFPTHLVMENASKTTSAHGMMINRTRISLAQMQD